MQKEFEGKAVIVTGSSSGIGEAIAILFAQKGAMVTLCGRDQDRLQQAQAKCREAGGTGSQDKYIAVCGDVNEASVRDNIIQNTKDKFGKIDILVCNHGVVLARESTEQATEETYDTIMNTNLKSVYFLIQKALPHLEETKGNIVNVSSVASTIASTATLAYAMSKAAMDHMTRCLALELGPKGIRVNAINPTMVPTRIIRHVPVDVKTLQETIGVKHPLHGRNSTPEEQADAVAFLASDRAVFITGECIKVDGAISLKVVA